MYFSCIQSARIQVITLGNFTQILVVTGDNLSKYTARPPQPSPLSEPVFCSFKGWPKNYHEYVGEGGRTVY